MGWEQGKLSVMATQIVETLLSDLSGKPIPEDSGGGTIEFAVSGRGYSIDLTSAELGAFNKALAPYLDAAQPTPQTRARRTPDGTGRRSREQLAAVRDWARKHGHPVSDRGRIPVATQEAFDAAH